MLSNTIRSDFPILSAKVNDNQLVYFDNSATTQKPQSVIDALVKYYTTYNSNIHRGIHELSEKATEAYEESKEKTASFINAKSWKEIIYTRNTTESLNLVAYTWALENLKKGDLIISTEMEHHSNIVQWQLISEKTDARVEFIPVKDDFTLDIEQYKKLLAQKPKIVTFTHASNVLGTINPAKELIALAKEVGALTIVDGAQSAPHMKIDVQDMDCDFYAFSSHKMCGPTGIGVLFGKEAILETMPPFLAGGDMINKVTLTDSTWSDLPWKFEAGTPNIADAIAFGYALDYLGEIGIENIEKHERELTSYAFDQMTKIKGLNVFGQDDTPKQRGGMIAFTLESAHPHDIAQLVNEDGIAIRSGHHCAQPIHDKFEKVASARASFYLYNTKEEIDLLVESIKKVDKMFR